MKEKWYQKLSFWLWLIIIFVVWYACFVMFGVKEIHAGNIFEFILGPYDLWNPFNLYKYLNEANQDIGDAFNTFNALI